MNARQRLFRVTVATALYLFWPAVMLVTWGELTPHPPHWTRFFWDKLLHFTAYFGLASMATLILRRGQRLVWALTALAIFGGALEILQGFTGRDPDIHDEIANCIGVAAGFLAALTFERTMRSRLVDGSTGG